MGRSRTEDSNQLTTRPTSLTAPPNSEREPSTREFMDVVMATLPRVRPDVEFLKEVHA